jgi:hypothetical protein
LKSNEKHTLSLKDFRIYGLQILFFFVCQLSLGNINIKENPEFMEDEILELSNFNKEI